jgi:hypothetical protein
MAGKLERRGKRITASSLIRILETMDSIENLAEFRNAVRRLRTSLRGCTAVTDFGDGGIAPGREITVSAIAGELEQMSGAYTLGRAKYYLHRLLRGLSETKENGINDLNMNRWKDYGDIITDSLWIFDRRDRSGSHNAGYWGNFIPQIPYQLLSRFTKRGDWVLDTFLGGGTTLIECRRLGRNGIGIELSAEAVKASAEAVGRQANRYGVRTEIIRGNSMELDYSQVLGKAGISSVQFILMHPPYWDIIKFSAHPDDLSNAPSIEAFLRGLRQVAERAYPYLEEGRYMALVIGDKYSGGVWIPLAFRSMEEILRTGCRLKSIIVKNFDETRGKKSQQELWRYRALSGGFYVFRHEYIFLFRKE